MRTAALALILLAVAPICEGKPHSTFRVHAQANTSNGPAFSTQLQLFGRQVTIEKVPTLSENDVIGFQSYRAADGTHGGLFLLNEHGRLALDSLSMERRTSSIFVFINGRPMAELQVDRRVSDGKVYIPSGLTSNDIALLKKDWPRKSPQ